MNVDITRVGYQHDQTITIQDVTDNADPCAVIITNLDINYCGPSGQQ